MRVILSAMGRAALRSGLVTFLALASGILAAPNLRQAAALAGAASIAVLIAAVRAVRVFVPDLSKAIGQAFHMPTTYAEVVVTIISTFLLGFLALGEGVLSAPDLSGAKAAAVAGVIAIGDGVVRVLQAVFTPGETPAPSAGIEVPAQPVPPAALPRTSG